MARRDKHGLAPRWRRFADEYLMDFNATRAYRAAGYKATGSGVYACASNLLRKPKVREYIDKRIAQESAQFRVSREFVLRRLLEIAGARMDQFASWDADGVKLLDSGELSDGLAGAVSEVVQSETQFGTNVKLKLHDPKVALTKLGEHLGLWTGDGSPLEKQALPWTDD